MNNKSAEDRDVYTAAEYAEAIKAALSSNGFVAHSDDVRISLYAGYLEYLAAENAKYNLTAIIKPTDASLLHITDSLTVADLPSNGARMLDIGSGAGLPAVPVAIARPDIQVTALDSTAKKVDFITQSAQKFRISNLFAVCGRAEDFAHDTASERSNDVGRGRFDFVTARGVAPLNILCELAAPFLKENGIFAAMKGSHAAEEIKEADSAALKLGLTLIRSVDLTLKQPTDDTLNKRTIVIYKKTGVTPEIYPRQYAKIKKSPL